MRSCSSCFLLAFLSVGLLAVGALPAAAQSTVYVEADASGTTCRGAPDGSSWDCAFASLQNALAAAQSGDELWVANGTYLPDDGDAQTAGSRDEAFHVPDGVAIYGGFDGTETSRSNRNSDPETNGTVLSGNIGVVSDATDNSFTIVVLCNAGPDTVVDGLTVQGGQSVFLLGGVQAPEKRGANSSQKKASQKSTGCDYGAALQDSGGIWVSGGTPVIRNVISMRNTSDYGGGITIVDGAAPTLQSVRLSSNTGRSEGGGLLCENSAPVLIDVTARGNTVGDSFPGSGGGITLNNCDGRYERLVLSQNGTGGTGNGSGGGAVINGGAPVILDVDVLENAAGLYGGGLMLRSSNATIIGADVRCTPPHSLERLRRLSAQTFEGMRWCTSLQPFASMEARRSSLMR